MAPVTNNHYQVALNSRNWFSSVVEARGLKSVLLCPNQGVGAEPQCESPLLGSCGFWRPLAFLTLWPQHSSPWLCGLVASPSVSNLCLSFTNTCVCIRAYPDSPGQTPHLKVLNLITTAKIPFCHWRWHSQVPGIRVGHWEPKFL